MQFCVALLAGCASYQAAPLSPAQNAAAIEARSLDDARLHKFIAAELGASDPAPGWDLARLTLAALYYHPDLDIARAGLEAARAAVTTAGQRPNPTLDLTAVFGTGAAAGAITAGAAPLTIGPVVNFVIETADKRQYRTARAQHLDAAARDNIATASWQVRGRVRGALMDLWAAEHRLALRRHRLALQDELVGLLQGRLAAGAASSLEIARERIRRAQVALALREADSARQDARARLATAIGIPLAALDRVKLSFAAFEQPASLPAGFASGALRRQALTRRSDVAAALARYEAAQSALQLAVARQYPNVTLGPGYQYDFGVNKYLFGPSLTLPIFNHNEGPIAEALAARHLAAARFTALQAGIIGAIDRAAANYRSANTTRAAARSLLDDARRRALGMRHAFAAGEADRPTLVAAELELGAAELARFDAIVTQREALGSVEDALQYPLFEPAAHIAAPEKDPRLSASPAT